MKHFFGTGKGKWFLTTGMGYAYFGSVVLTTAITIPVALKYLGKEQYGLWAISSQLLSYLLLFDGGLSRSLSRLVGEAVKDPEDRAASRCFCLLVMLCFLTACIMFLLAIITGTWGLRVLSVPAPFLGIGFKLFLSIMGLQCIGYMFGPFNAVLYAQNRTYISAGIKTIAVLANAVIFVLLLRNGYGLMSYVYANMLLVPLTALGPFICFLRSSNRPMLVWIRPVREDFKQILSFTSWMFISSLVTESLMALPTLLITKFLGLEAMALFYVSFRPAFFLHRFSIIPFQGLAPRWQLLYLNKDLNKLREEYLTGMFIVLQSGLVLCSCFVVSLKPLITLWIGPTMYGGALLTFVLGVYLIVYLLGNTLSVPFVLAKKLGFMTVIQSIELVCSFVTCIFLSHRFGSAGVIGGSVCLTALFTVQYYWRKGPVVLGFSSGASEIIFRHLRPLVVQSSLVFLSITWVYWSDIHNFPLSNQITGALAICAASICYFLHTTGRTAWRVARQRINSVIIP